MQTRPLAQRIRHILILVSSAFSPQPSAFMSPQPTYLDSYDIFFRNSANPSTGNSLAAESQLFQESFIP